MPSPKYLRQTQPLMSNNPKTQNAFLRPAATILAITALICGAIFASVSLASNTTVTYLVTEIGYAGVVGLAVIAGLNAVVPVPAATFSPLFASAGLSTIGIITALVLGTVIADALGFVLGASTRKMAQNRYKKFTENITNLARKHRSLLIPIVIIYAAFVPFPNEALVIPLAYAGIRLRTLLFPLLVGNIIHQTILVYSVLGLTTHWLN